VARPPRPRPDPSGTANLGVFREVGLFLPIEHAAHTDPCRHHKKYDSSKGVRWTPRLQYFLLFWAPGLAGLEVSHTVRYGTLLGGGGGARARGGGARQREWRPGLGHRALAPRFITARFLRHATAKYACFFRSLIALSSFTYPP